MNGRGFPKVSAILKNDFWESFFPIWHSADFSLSTLSKYKGLSMQGQVDVCSFFDWSDEYHKMEKPAILVAGF